MKFEEVAQVFDTIDTTSSRLIITQLLADLFKKASPHEAAIIANLSLGMLRPPYQGTRFNFAKKSFAAVLATFGNITKDHLKKMVDATGDLGTVAQQISTAHSDKNFSVIQLYEQLAEIETISGTGSQEEKSNKVLQLLQAVSPLEAKYIVRMVLNELRLGFSDMTIIDALSWMETGNKKLRVVIEDAYNICADIGFIAYILKKNGIEAIQEMSVHVGIPIRLAASERLPTPEAILKKIGPGCLAQPKLDGLRVQAHINNQAKENEQRITLFSRNLLNVTHMFPELVKALKTVPVDQMICDGEAIAFDPDVGSYLPFQETAKRKRKHGVEQASNDFPMQFNIFDVLFVDGQTLLNKTYTERYAILKQIVSKTHSPAIRLVAEMTIENSKQLEAFFLVSIEAGLEGVMVKKPDALYQAGKRNFNWIKLKRIETGSLEDTIDCVILGYNNGSGKRASFGIGAFLAGVFNKKKDCFQTIAKVGTGLSDQQWKELKKKCDHVAVKEKPKNVECSKELFPDVWLAPEIVCSIRADEITESPLHTAGKTSDRLGFALRFPRFMGYRPDKLPEQATEIEELEHMFKDQKVRKQ